MNREPTIRERLTRLETLLKEVHTNLNNHLQHHFLINITLLGCIVTEAVALLIIVIKSLI